MSRAFWAVSVLLFAFPISVLSKDRVACILSAFERAPEALSDPLSFRRIRRAQQALDQLNEGDTLSVRSLASGRAYQGLKVKSVVLADDGSISHAITHAPDGTEVQIYAHRIDPDSVQIRPKDFVETPTLPPLTERGQKAADILAGAQPGQEIEFTSAVSGNHYQQLRVKQVVRDDDGIVRLVLATNSEGMNVSIYAERANPDSIKITGTPAPPEVTAVPVRSVEEFAEKDRELASVLLERLPPGRLPVKGSDTPLTNYSFVHQGSGAETLMILNDAQLDPKLHQWLGEVKNRFKEFKGTEKDLKNLAEHVAKVMSGTGEDLLHPLRNRRFKELTQESRFSLLGDFIAAGAGVCRHRAPALYLALKEMGVESRLRYGNVKRFAGERAVDEEKVIDGLHVWVEVVLDEDRVMLLDPTQNVYQVIPNTSGRRHRYVNGGVSERLDYDPSQHGRSVVIGGHRQISQEDIEDLLGVLGQK